MQDQLVQIAERIVETAERAARILGDIAGAKAGQTVRFHPLFSRFNQFCPQGLAFRRHFPYFSACFSELSLTNSGFSLGLRVCDPDVALSA